MKYVDIDVVKCIQTNMYLSDLISKTPFNK